DDGTIIDIHKPGTAQQSVSFTDIAGVTAGHAGLDDVIRPDATSGTFTLTDTATNKVYSFHAAGLNPNDYYASVGSLHAFGQVDPATGAFTPLLSADNAPGFNFSSPHGVSFTADPQPAVADAGGKQGPSIAGMTTQLASLIASFGGDGAIVGGNVISDPHKQIGQLAIPTRES
ncbi:MAG: hypothetical protein JO141_19560, partial [Bradyrhizobium sp.]|nr:hypothetical protein [Bradyrhizobium sp.]